jgi:AraC family L-rhamnose operon regulatory protein RhaS
MKAKAPLVFVNAGRVFRADTCEPLKAASARGDLSVLGWSRASYPGTPIPQQILPGVLSLGSWDAPTCQSWGLGEHCNEGLEITYLSRGNLDFVAEGRPHRLSAGDVTVLAPWQPHEVGRPFVEPSRLLWFIIDLGVRRPNQAWRWPDWVLLSAAERHEIARVIQGTDRSVWTVAALAPLFAQLHVVLQTGDPVASETDMKILLNAILVRLARAIMPDRTTPLPPRDNARETVRLFLNRLGEHLDYPWRVEEMAKQCGVPRGVFIVKCREIVNRTPHAYLMQLRIERACHLLRSGTTPLTEVALSCGFGSSAHFSFSFRKEAGQSPTQFRDAAVRAARNEPPREVPLALPLRRRA